MGTMIVQHTILVPCQSLETQLLIYSYLVPVLLIYMITECFPTHHRAGLQV